MGGVNGGLEGALKGAAMGFLMGAVMGAGYQALGNVFVAAAAVGGAVYSGVAGGAEGLGDFAAGMAGAVCGSIIGNAIVNSGSYNQAQTNETQASPESKQAVKEAVGTGDFEQIKGAVEQGTGKPSGVSGNDVAEALGDAVKTGEFGRGNNPVAQETQGQAEQHILNLQAKKAALDLKEAKSIVEIAFSAAEHFNLENPEIEDGGLMLIKALGVISDLISVSDQRKVINIELKKAYSVSD